MSMTLELTVSQAFYLDQRLRQELTGGWTESIFPEVERWLNDGDKQRALMHVGDRRSMQRYRSTIDYVFAQVFPDRRREVFAFYLGGDEPLRDVTTTNDRAVMAAEMILALEVAHGLWCERRIAGWHMVRQIVRELAA